jgi:flagellar assembly protein FliH
MAAATKFMFNADFSLAGREEAEPRITAAAHAAAITEAEARGYRAGLAAAEARERTEAERKSAAAFDRIGVVLAGFAASLTALQHKLEVEAIEIATVMARKLVPALIAREPTAEIEALAATCLAELRSAPHVVVRLHDSLIDKVRPQLDAIARAKGFEGRLVVLGDDQMARGDCRIEWADGGVVRNLAATESAVEELVARYIAARTPGAQN